MGMESNFGQPSKPPNYNEVLSTYIQTFNKSKSGELPIWGDKTQFEVSMDDLKNLAEGNLQAESKMDVGSTIAQVAEYYHKGWKQEDFANLYKEVNAKNQEAPNKEEVPFGEEKVACRRIDMLKEFEEKFKTADSYRKVGKVDARQATVREKISTSQDGNMDNYAEPGDWIIQNPGDKDPYVFGNKEDPIEVRQAKFAKKYEPKPNSVGVFIPKGIIKAVRIDENLVFNTSWGEQMAVKAGGWVADGGYPIAEDSFSNTYEKIENKQE